MEKYKRLLVNTGLAALAAGVAAVVVELQTKSFEPTKAFIVALGYAALRAAVGVIAEKIRGGQLLPVDKPPEV